MPDDVIFEFEEYHCVFGHVFYSPDLGDGLQIQSLLGPNLTVTVAPNGTRYLNDAEIISSDYLINTGVIHVLAHTLDPNKTDTRPNLSAVTNSTIQPSTSSGSPSSLSTAAKAGIGIGVGVVVLLAIGALYFYFRRKRSQKPQSGIAGVQEKVHYTSEMPHPDNSYSQEMDAPVGGIRRELDGRDSRRAESARVYEVE